MAEDKTIVSRIQHRRGLKQDLPQPLRAGEIGLATDSRQVFIGGDASNPQNVDYNAISYIENTAGAKTHMTSIANNNIIAFQVPYIKYKRGDFDSIINSQSWLPSNARSTDAASNKGQLFNNSTFPIFSTAVTNTVTSTISADTTGTVTVYVNKDASDSTASDTLGNIRVGDHVTFGGVIPAEPIIVDSVAVNDASSYIITVNSQQTLTTGTAVAFIPKTVKNYVTGGAFTSSEVTVKKNGIAMISETNPSLFTPSAVSDFTLNGTSTTPDGTHTLRLRTAPGSSEEVTLCYYSNANVIAAFEGVGNKIAVTSSISSFYDAHSIPDYRRIPKENIRVSTESGLGYIALNTKHISSVADGANISTPSSISLGNLMVSREDIKSTSSLAVDGSDLATYVVSLASPSDNVYKTIGGTDIYRYDRAYLKTVNNTTGYLHKHVFDIADSDGSSGTLKITIPQKTWIGARSSTATLSSDASLVNNGFTNASHDRTIITLTPSNSDTDGVAVGHYVRLVDTSGSPSIELHDKMLKVVSKSSTTIDVDLDQLGGGNTAPTFTANITNNLAFVNHATDSTGDDSVQIYSPDHLITSGVTNVYLNQTGAGGVMGAGANISTTIETSSITSNTFITTGVTMPIATALDEISGTFFPVLLASYTSVAVHPVLAIDLSSDTTLTAACARVNTPTVSIPAVSATATSIFSSLRELPQTNGTFNAVYFSQRPGFSSVSAGGLEFVLHEDKDVATCSVLGLTAGEYNRNNSSVKAKLERWMNSLVNSRDVQLFTKVFHGGSQYSTFPYNDTNAKSIYNGKTAVPNHLTQYNLEIDNTYNEIFFSSREESGNFNTLTNNLFSSSTFDKAQDTTNGTKGLVNLKNNLEIQTREAASFGEKVETYESLEVVTILESNTSTDVILSLDASVYNTFALDYTITESAGLPNKYLRMGTMQISARPDWTTSPTTAVIFADRFSSSWDLTHANPVVEPKFEATLNGNNIELKMDLQYSDPANPTVGQEAVHTLQATLRMKYVARRWSSTA